MEHSCFTHPTRQALSFCHSCGRYFCSDCLVEGEEFYYCKDEACQNGLRQETVRISKEPEKQAGTAWICPDCNYSNSDESVKCACGYVYGEKDESETTSSKNAVEHTNTSKLCPSCGKEVPFEDKFCSFCGKSTIILSEKEKQKIQKASKWILAISILFIVFGTILGFMQKSVAEKAQENLAQFEESHVLETPINGKQYTVGELRSKVNQEVILVFFTNYFLAAVMFALYLWARRSPFPAMVTALCVYLAVIVLNGIIDPKTLIQGVVIKVIFISAIVAGIKASLVARSVSEA
jgi:predicted nucleic acid-binding Zn ribbon protein